MLEENNPVICIVIEDTDHKQEVFAEGRIGGIRVYPACQSHEGSPALSLKPEELNEAVQMRMNRENDKLSFRGQMALAERDAEIIALRKRCEDNRELAATHVKMIEEKSAKITRLNEEVVRSEERMMAEGMQFEDRIAELEKLCDMQRANLDAQGNALREAREKGERALDQLHELHDQIANGLSHEETMGSIEECIDTIAPGTSQIIHSNQPAQKAPEPELFICPEARVCKPSTCFHNQPHTHGSGCMRPSDSKCHVCSDCIPVKKPVPQPSPVPTSGTAPEGAMADPERPSPPGDTIRDIMEEQGISRFKLARMLEISDSHVLALFEGRFLIDNDMACRLSEKLGSTPDFWEKREKQYRDNLKEYQSTVGILKDPDCTDNFADHTYPGTAKDLGDLTLRLDNAESSIQHHNARLHEVEQRQGRDRAELMEIIRCLQGEVHNNREQIEPLYDTKYPAATRLYDLERGMKALQGEIRNEIYQTPQRRIPHGNGKRPRYAIR
ncbi:transcriptional regulator [Methanoregula sp.]|jgi:HTH-type transcriptional regulator/antitoxin HigA|uniref:helix-turn-helix transcriptional regulator n=1 Tax=Methanoregula sp. TaxID=2052170 RepID=UPI00356593EC